MGRGSVGSLAGSVPCQHLGSGHVFMLPPRTAERWAGTLAQYLTLGGQRGPGSPTAPERAEQCTRLPLTAAACSPPSSLPAAGGCLLLPPSAPSQTPAPGNTRTSRSDRGGLRVWPWGGGAVKFWHCVIAPAHALWRCCAAAKGQDQPTSQLPVAAAADAAPTLAAFWKLLAVLPRVLPSSGSLLGPAREPLAEDSGHKLLVSLKRRRGPPPWWWGEVAATS